MDKGNDQPSPDGGRVDDPPGAPGVHQGARRLGLLLLAVHVGLVLWLAFQPVSAAWIADTNLTPFATVRAEIELGTARAYLELLRGLLLLAPLGLLLPLAGGRRDAAALPSFLRTVFAGLLIATGVEVLESTLTSHLLNVDNVLLAGVGIALTHLLFVPGARAALRRHEPDAPRPSGFEIAPSPN